MVYHRVKSGDTLGKIARIYGTSVSELCRLNGIKPTTVLRVGQSIRCNAGASYVVKKKKTAKPSVTVEAQNEPLAAVATEQNDAAGNQPIYHKIQSGDTLGAIAQKYGTTVSKLCELNGITRTTILRLGRTLRCS